VNESEGNLAFAFPEEAVAGDKCFFEPTDAVDKVLLAFAVVMQMNLDVRDSIGRYPLKRFHETGPIFLLRIEEGIAGRPSARIMKLLGDGRPEGRPSSDPLCSRKLVDAVPERLKVIGKEQPESFCGLACESLEPVLYIAWEPDLAVPGQFHDWRQLISGGRTPHFSCRCGF